MRQGAGVVDEPKPRDITAPHRIVAGGDVSIKAQEGAVAAGMVHNLNVYLPGMPAAISESSEAKAGRVVAWGGKAHGQINVPAGLRPAVAIAAGETHSLALHSDGTITAWGGNSLLPRNLYPAKAIAAGARHSLALNHDGTITVWGHNGNPWNPLSAGLPPTVAIAGGGRHDLALHSDGTVTTWPDYAHPRTVVSEVPAGLPPAVAIAAGTWHSLAITGDVSASE